MFIYSFFLYNFEYFHGPLLGIPVLETPETPRSVLEEWVVSYLMGETASRSLNGFL